MDIGRGNEASECSRTGIEESDQSGIGSRQPELVVGNRNTTHSSERSTVTGDDAKRHLELGDETGRSKPSEGYPGGGIESNPFCFNSEVSSERFRLSSSSLSSGSSTDEQFRADTKLPESRSGMASTSSSKVDDHVSGSATSKSQVPDLMHDPTLTQSPPVQVMNRVEGYDPYRIPSSVFERRKSVTPADWSMTSNDSLFSIQVEDHSFSGDHGLNLKSEELFRSQELFTINQSPVASALDPDKMSVEFDNSPGNLISDDTLKGKTGPSAEEPIGEKPAHAMRFWNSPTPSNHSDDTGTSEKDARPPWYCSDCSRAFCYCWNRSIKRCLEGGRNVVFKEEKREQQQRTQEQDQDQEQEQPLAPASPSESSCCCNSCFCFSCCRRRWRCCNWNWRCSGSRCCRGKCK